MDTGVFSTDIHLAGLANSTPEIKKPRARFTGHVPKTQIIEMEVDAAQPDAEAPKSEVLSTTDYTKFKNLKSNRDIDAAHVRRLCRAIKKKNHLHLFPVLVNGSFEVMDGQHRIEAAKQLGVPVYFIVDDNIGDGDIADMNSNKKGWTMLNYIDYHAAKGNQDYVKFAHFCNKHNHISPSTLVFLCDSTGTRNTDTIKNGELDISNMEVAETVISHLNYFQSINKKVASQVRFIEAVLAIVGTGLYDHNRMVQKLNQQPTKLVPCVDRKAYISVIEDIYNYKVRDESFIKFFKR